MEGQKDRRDPTKYIKAMTTTTPAPTPPPTVTPPALTNQDSTFVAAILSSMATTNDQSMTSNHHHNPNHNNNNTTNQSAAGAANSSSASSNNNNNHYSIPSSTSSGAYASTSTPASLTPSNLGNLQQAFIELQSVPSSSSGDPNHSYVSGGAAHPLDQSGGSSYSQYEDSCDEDSSAEPRAIGIGKIGAKIKEEKDDIMQSLMRNRLCPEEEERRRIRRERNKIAAAKCRQRRVDHTNRLIQETEKLEEERATLQDEIHTLRQQKDQLEFILQAHRPLCKAPNPKSAMNDVKVKTERDLVASCGAGANMSLPLATIKQERNAEGYYGYSRDSGLAAGAAPAGGSSPTLISL